MPDHATLSQAVALLTRPHERTVGEHTGQEPALLDLLEVAIKSDTSGASGEGTSGSSTPGNPVDVNALHIWQTIYTCVGEFWPGKGQLVHAHLPLKARLEWWTSSIAGTENEVHLEEMCDYWAGLIRDLLEPPKRVPIRGGQCPRCKEHQVLGTDPDGQRVYQPTLLAHMSESPLRVECRACGGTWYSLDMLKLEVDVVLGDASGTLVTR
jgi:hypothetical protein